MPTCGKCNKEVGFLDRLSYNKQTGRCGPCEKEYKYALDRFRQAFLWYCQDGVLTDEEWSSLRVGATQEGVRMDDALAYIRGDALHLLERTVTFVSADGLVTEEEERNVLRLRQLLGIPHEIAQPVFQRLAYLRHITNLRQGDLPRIQPSVRLESDEFCHLESPATYHKVNAKSVTQVPGRLLATSKKLRFLSPTGGMEIAWKNVMRAEMQAGGVYLELSVKRGNGYYAVQDPLATQATCDALARMDKRQLIAPSDADESRHIPQDVKQAVWQRDGGKCVQCGATSYLEFDHIIPHSKGGANTVNNIQLLCRRCNGLKGDRI